MESEFPGNSRNPVKPTAAKPEAPAKKVEQVTTNPVKKRKKTLGKRFRETYNVEDTRTVGEFLFTDVLVPRSKDLIFDLFSMGLERKLFGDTLPASHRRTGGGLSGGGGGVQYNKITSAAQTLIKPDPRTQQQAAGMNRRARATHNFDDYVIETRAEATGIIDQLYAILDQYNVVSVLDLYAMLGVVPDFTDESWGWFNLQGADVQRTRDGYILNLPRPEPIN